MTFNLCTTHLKLQDFLCIFIFAHLSSTDTDIEVMEVLGSFWGKAWAIHQWPHWPKWAEVKSQSGIAFCVGEVTITIA